MEPLSGRMKFVILFLVGSIAFMFVDGLFFDNYNTRPSMAMMHMEMRPPMYNDPHPPSQEEFFAQYQLYPDSKSDPDTPLKPDIIMENGVQIKVYRLQAQNVLHEIRPGVKVPMITFNGQMPAPTIRVNEGDYVRVILYNNGTDPHTIHWHGIEDIANDDDGVPDVNQVPVDPGKNFTYDFVAGPSGTKMYHCHVEAPHHITMGMYGALIIDPKKPDQIPFNDVPKNVTVQENIFMFSEYDTSHLHTPLPGEMTPMGPDKDILPWLIPNPKFMMPFDPNLNEFMVNGKAFPATKEIILKQGEVVHWKLINIGLVAHSIHIHGHHFTVTHKDGFLLPAPFQADTLFIGPGERYDVWFKADNPGIWMIHDHAGLNAMDNGFDPGGAMWVIKYEGVDSSVYDEFLKRVQVYDETIEHADQEHGMLTPSGANGMQMNMQGMSGMNMGGK